MAKIFLEAGDTDVTASNAGDEFFVTPTYNGSLTRILVKSGAGADASGISATLLANTILEFDGLSNEFSFTPNLSTGKVTVTKGGLTVAVLPVESNLSTARLSFADGLSEIILTDTGGGNFATSLGTMADDTSRAGTKTSAFNIQSNAGGQVTEGNTATFTIENTYGTAGTVNYTITLGGGASSADHGDITVAGTVNNTLTGTLTFADSDKTKTISIPIVTDSTTETGESITVTLSNATGATLGKSSSSLTLKDAALGDVTYPITSSGSTSANGNATFNITVGNYSHTITDGFASGDKLVFSSGSLFTISNTSATDGSLDVIAANAGLQAVTTITLTGLSTADDGAVFNLSSFLTTFGAGSLA